MNPQQSQTARDVVLAITGASGAIYALRLLQVLLASDRHIHLSISPSARLVLAQELNLAIDLERFDPAELPLSKESPNFERLSRAMAEVLGSVAKRGLPGAHHFYISFDTTHPGVDIPAYLRERHPKEMMIVLQDWFDDLAVMGDRFRVTLNFANRPETLVIPLDAVKTFVPPNTPAGVPPPKTTSAPPAGITVPDGNVWRTVDPSESVNPPMSSATVVVFVNSTSSSSVALAIPSPLTSLLGGSASTSSIDTSPTSATGIGESSDP